MHKHTRTSQPTFVPDLDIPFDLEFRRTHSIDDFAELLAEHLSKTQKGRETAEKMETCFMSTSPILEWIFMTAGQKWRNIKKLRQSLDTTLFCVEDILRFLRSQGKDWLIGKNVQKWAQNCDEYVFALTSYYILFLII